MARPEQTEKATPKRVHEARQRGQVAKSQDVSGAVIFIAIITTLHFTFLPTLDAGAQSFAIALSHAGSHDDLNAFSTWGLFTRAASSYILLVASVFSAAVLLGVTANVLQFGFVFSLYSIKPKFAKLNPISGFKRLFFSGSAFENLAKQIAKVTLVGIIVYMVIHDRLTMFYALGHASPRDMVVTVESLLYGVGIRFGLCLLAIGLLDFFWQKKQLADSLKMSKTEVRDENRQTEGNPELKQAVRNRQRQTARRRMMAAVPKATVVVTNPTHFAVALEWDEITMDAPVLTAKGADLMARRIRELAREHNVPILENPPLARTLYDKVELDSPVPPNLYSAVAQVIAFVYKLKNRTIA
jgi:flagellar biosynthesis protein FlhB